MALSFLKKVRKRLGIFSSPQKSRKIKIDYLEKEARFLRVMSFNVKGVKDRAKKEPSWNFRKTYVASMIRFHRMDLIGFQEPLHTQVRDLQELLAEYDWYGIGLDDGKKEGAHNAIFWKRSRFDVYDKGYFFLSPTPTIPGLAWGAYYVRGVTWVKLRDKKTNKMFVFFNTHFDYHSATARNQSALLLLKKAEEIGGVLPYVIVGDFNLFPKMRGKQTYQLLISKGLIDAQNATYFPHHGPTGTWSGFEQAGQPGIKPDYIFVKNQGTVVISHGILSDTFDGRFPSDHLPVVAEIVLI